MIRIIVMVDNVCMFIKKIMRIIRNNIYHQSSLLYHNIITDDNESKRKGSSLIVTLTLRLTVLQDWRQERCILIPLPKNGCCYIGEKEY